MKRRKNSWCTATECGSCQNVARLKTVHFKLALAIGSSYRIVAVQKCDDAHALAGGRSTISSSDDTHVVFQDYGGNVAMVPGECDRKTLSVAAVLLCSSACAVFCDAVLCLLSVSRSINVWLKKQARCALIQHTTCFRSSPSHLITSRDVLGPSRITDKSFIHPVQSIHFYTFFDSVPPCTAGERIVLDLWY